jgi:transposase
MITAEAWMDIRQLREQGLGIRAISRRLGISRKTVRKALAQDRPPERQRRTKPSKLDPYKPYLQQRLQDYPELTAKRLLEEIQGQGFTGGYSILKDYVTTIRPKKEPIAVLRFETPPGHQAQVDWAEFGHVVIDNIKFKLYLFSMVLGYSRMRYIEFTLDTRTPTLLQCHLNAFNYFGGYTNEILYDNMSTIVDPRSLNSGSIKWNPTFEMFSKHFGFTPRLCRPYRAQTKGKTERVIGYVRTDFFEGREFMSLQDINSQGRTWCDKVNDEPHRETHIAPRVALKDEPLNQLSNVPEYVVTRKHYRIVSRECYVSFEGNRYSVPWKYAYKNAVLEVQENRLTIKVDGTPVAVHQIVRGPGRRVKDPRHFEGLSEALGGRRKKVRPVMDWTPVHEVVTRPLEEYERTLEEFVEESE